MPILSGRHFLETEMKLAERYFSSRKGVNRALIVETSEHTPFVAPCPLVPSIEIAFKRAVIFRSVTQHSTGIVETYRAGGTCLSVCLYCHKVQPSKMCSIIRLSANFCQTTRRLMWSHSPQISHFSCPLSSS